MNRGDRREPIFKNDNDRLLFLKTLGEACQKTDWQVHAWCLMSNHFHLRTAVEGRGSRPRVRKFESASERGCQGGRREGKPN
jgi:REP element-mobilizing transposase RayT